MTKLNRIALGAAGLGGALWTVKALIITARDGSFDPLESYVFVGGLLALVAASLLVPLALASRLGPLARVAVTAGGLVALVAATLALEAIGKALAGSLYDGGNLGIAQESGILLAGVVWLAVAVLLGRRERLSRPAAA